MNNKLTKINMFVTFSSSSIILDVLILLSTSIYNRLLFGPGTFLRRHDHQLPSLSGVHGLKDFLCSAHLLESFDGRIYTY